MIAPLFLLVFFVPWICAPFLLLLCASGNSRREHGDSTYDPQASQPLDGTTQPKFEDPYPTDWDPDDPAGQPVDNTQNPGVTTMNPTTNILTTNRPAHVQELGLHTEFAGQTEAPGRTQMGRTNRGAGTTVGSAVGDGTTVMPNSIFVDGNLEEARGFQTRPPVRPTRDGRGPAQATSRKTTQRPVETARDAGRTTTHGHGHTRTGYYKTEAVQPAQAPTTTTNFYRDPPAANVTAGAKTARKVQRPPTSYGPHDTSKGQNAGPLKPLKPLGPKQAVAAPGDPNYWTLKDMHDMPEQH